MRQYKRHGDYNAWSIGSILFWALVAGIVVMAALVLVGVVWW